MKKFSLGLLFFILVTICNFNIIAQNAEWIWVAPPKYEKISDFSEGIAAVKQNVNWGYINENGDLIIDNKFSNITNFQNNEAMVYIKNRWYLIDKSGKINDNISFSKNYRFVEGLALDISIHYTEEEWEDFKFCGYINKENEQVIKNKYSDARDFSEGLAAVKKGNKWGYINKNNESIIEFQFENAYSFNNDIAMTQMNDKWGYINKNGDFIIECKYNNIKEFSENLAAVKMNDKWGYIDISGKTIIENNYENTFGFSESFAAVSSSGKWGFIDLNGSLKIDYQFSSTTSFNSGIAFVKKEDKWGCINKSGQLLIDFQFDEVKNSHNGIFIVKKNGLWGIGYPKNIKEDIKEYVNNKLNQWQQKGRYEKTEEFLIRVNEKTRSSKSQELVQEAINHYALQEKTMNIESVAYDADNEAFKLTFTGLNPIYLKVPISEAKSFDSNISAIKYSDYQFTLTEDDKFELIHMKAINPSINKSYIYDAENAVAFNLTKLDLKFGEIDVKINKSLPTESTETVSTVNVGLSDVDLDIPINSTNNENTFALIIGNEDYEHEIKVDYAKNDAFSFKQYVIKTLCVPENQVHFIQNATYGDFLHGLDWLNKVAKGYKGEAKLILFYAGHGMPDQSTKDAFILPIDSYSSNTKTAIKLQDIYSDLNEFPTKSVTVFLDACFSGSSREGMLADGRGVRIIPKEQTVENNMVVFTAVSGDETAHPFEEKQHGLFTYYLLKKLQETKGDVTLGELQKYITTNVLKKSVVLHKEQNPTTKASATLSDSWKDWKLK